MARIQERLARVEAQLEQILLTVARTHAELKEQADRQRTFQAAEAERLAALEQEQAETWTHLRWMKGIWAAVQAVVVAVVGK